MRLRTTMGLAGSAIAMMGTSLYAQAPYAVVPAIGTPVNGADSEFTVNVTVAPADVDISGFSFQIAYDNTQVTLESVSDNTGQPAAAVEYTLGEEQPFAGSPNVNVSVPVIMDTAFSLQAPSQIAQLNFRSTPGFNSGIYLYLDDHLDEGLIDSEFQPVLTQYTPLQVPTSVEEWMMY